MTKTTTSRIEVLEKQVSQLASVLQTQQTFNAIFNKQDEITLEQMKLIVAALETIEYNLLIDTSVTTLAQINKLKELNGTSTD